MARQAVEKPTSIPMACPVCGEVITGTPGSTKDHITVPPITTEQAMRAHGDAHKPTAPCTHRESHPDRPTDAPYWVLDMDLVRHPRADMSLWYCHPCGFYSPLTPA